MKFEKRERERDRETEGKRQTRRQRETDAERDRDREIEGDRGSGGREKKASSFGREFSGKGAEASRMQGDLCRDESCDV